jgi:hypothetical protein
MNRWTAGAAIMAACALPLAPLEALAQDAAKYTCGFTAKYSLVTLQNLTKKRTLCRWRCIYTTPAGVTHINTGAKAVAAGKTLTSRQGFKGISAVVGSYGDCP